MPKSNASKTKASLRGYLPESSFVMAKRVKRSPVQSLPIQISVPASATTNTPPSAVSASRLSSIAEIAEVVSTCIRCKLCEKRIHTVPGEGNLQPELLFVGEGPGENEDQQGRPFVGPAGQLLDKMIQAMGVKRQEVFITNVVKCRPPNNRAPEPDETLACAPFLKAQIDCLNPKVIVALGATAAKHLLGVETPVGKMRGKVHEFEGKKIIVTYHPSYLLSAPEAKKDSWEDLKVAMRELGWSGPKKA